METKRSFKCYLVALASIFHLCGVAKANTRGTEDVTPSAACTEYSAMFHEFAGRLKNAIRGGLFKASMSEEDEKALLASFDTHLKNSRCDLASEDWNSKADTKKKRHVAHEVCLLLALESEGDYDTSRALMGLWKN